MGKGEKPTRKGCVSSVPVLGRKSLPCSLSRWAPTVSLCAPAAQDSRGGDSPHACEVCASGQADQWPNPGAQRC